MTRSRAPSDARTQGAPIVETLGATEDAAARRVPAGEAPAAVGGRATSQRLSALPDAAARDSHLRSLRDLARLHLARRRRGRVPTVPPYLPPVEERHRAEED